MFTSFKNSELFRYFVRVDLEKNINKILRQNKSNYSLIVGSVFSGSFSILSTYYSINVNRFEGALRIVVATLIYVLSFIIGMGIFNIIKLILEHFINARKKESKPTKNRIKEYIDDFDHIACDNILISQEFIKVYNDSDTSPLLKEFYFYEISYYTKVSLMIIQKLVTNKESCINDKQNTDRIHLFRLINALSMIDQICIFLENNKDKLGVDNLLQPSVTNMISHSRSALEYLKKECVTIKESRYSTP